MARVGIGNRNTLAMSFKQMKVTSAHAHVCTFLYLGKGRGHCDKKVTYAVERSHNRFPHCLFYFTIFHLLLLFFSRLIYLIPYYPSSYIISSLHSLTSLPSIALQISSSCLIFYLLNPHPAAAWLQYHPTSHITTSSAAPPLPTGTPLQSSRSR